MKKRKTNFIAMVLLLILVLGGATGAVWHFSNGFTDWSFGKKPSTPQIVEKYIEKTIIETESYGTFTLPKNYLRTSCGYLLKNKTQLDYFLNEYFIQEGFSAEEIAEYIDKCKIAVYFDNDVQNYFNVNYVANSINDYGYDLYTFENNEFFYTYSGNVSQVKESIHLGIMADSGNEKVFIPFELNVFVEEYVFVENSFLRAIISDTGVPLTNSIYESIMSDTATKITYIYEEKENV